MPGIHWASEQPQVARDHVRHHACSDVRVGIWFGSVPVCRDDKRLGQEQRQQIAQHVAA